MSISDKIARLQTSKSDIANAITIKGGTVESEDGFEDFATDIASIPSGSSGTEAVHSWDIYIDTDVGQGTRPTVVQGDTWVAQNYDNIKIFIFRISSSVDNVIEWYENIACYAVARSTASGNISFMSMSNIVEANSSGNILLSYGGTTRKPYMFKIGYYKLVAWVVN